MSELADMERALERQSKRHAETGVRCNQCRHADLNEYSPMMGFCLCEKFPRTGGGFANAERACAGFEPKRETT